MTTRGLSKKYQGNSTKFNKTYVSYKRNYKVSTANKINTLGRIRFYLVNSMFQETYEMYLAQEDVQIQIDYDEEPTVRVTSNNMVNNSMIFKIVIVN
jgi:hypothetical protein